MSKKEIKKREERLDKLWGLSERLGSKLKDDDLLDRYEEV